MHYRVFGKAGVKVSEIGLGTWAMGGPAEVDGKPIGWGPADDGESLRALHRARELGVNFFDTADVYGFGHSEELLGRAFAGDWQKIYVASKVGNRRYPGGQTTKDFTRGYVLAACDSSLKRLQKECLDLYQLHNPSLEVLRSGDWPESMEELQKAGKIRWYGASVTSVEEAQAFLDRGKGHSLQLLYNLLRQEAAQVFEQALGKNIAIIARVPLYFGLLAGKMTAGTRFPPDDHRSQRFSPEVLEQELAKLAKLEFLKAAGYSLAQIALKFAVSDAAVATTIPGARRVAQVEENCSASDGNLLKREWLEKIKELHARNFDLSLGGMEPHGPAR